MTRPAGQCPRAWTLFGSATIVGLIADLWSKYLAFRHIADTPVVLRREDVLTTQHLGNLLPPHDPVVVIPSVLELTLVLNPGAVFGIGAGKRWFFVVFTVFAVGLATWLFARKTHARDWWAHLAFALVVAGGLGNLYDRVKYGCVRDFLHPLPGVPLPFGLRWPGGSTELWPYVSNIADAFLLIGIGLLLIYSWRTPPKPGTGAKDKAAAASKTTG
ncbi:MAG: signal peptidase II [Phycisphaerales bacterium]|nr:signal peptidase II [Planctomycetota bacterium]MCH8508228.1 signal peptidase II [Phycisphaerales bacterium]